MTPGPQFLLLHGTPLDPSVWDDVAARLEPHGAVWCPALNVTAPRSGLLQGDLARVLAARIEGPVHVVGHSFGGQVAIEVALAVPQHVRSVSVICSRDTPFPPFATAAAALRAGAPIDVDAALMRWFQPGELQADGPVVAYARRRLVEADRSGWADALDAIACYDRADSVAQITAPFALLAAEHDLVSTPQAMSELAARVPDAEVTVAAGAGHMSPFLDPDGLAQLILGAAHRSAGR